LAYSIEARVAAMRADSAASSHYQGRAERVCVRRATMPRLPHMRPEQPVLPRPV